MVAVVADEESRAFDSFLHIMEKKQRRIVFEVVGQISLEGFPLSWS